MLSDIMKPITTCTSFVNTLSCNLEGMLEDLMLIRQDMHIFKEIMSAAEERTSTVEDSLHTALNSNKKCLQQLSIHDSQLEDMENCLHQNNIRIVGLLEQVEGNMPVEFIEKWLISTMGSEQFYSFFFSGERAHRVPARVSPMGGHLEPLFVEL